MNWKNGAAWEAVPTAALYGTYAGTAHVNWPQARAVDGLGQPCGAVGRPEIVIETAWMQDTGFDFWRDRFAATTSEYASISVEVFDPRIGADTKYTGLLHRPTFASLSRGAAAASTVYRNVRIVISECEATA